MELGQSICQKIF